MFEFYKDKRDEIVGVIEQLKSEKYAQYEAFHKEIKIVAEQLFPGNNHKKPIAAEKRHAAPPKWIIKSNENWKNST